MKRWCAWFLCLCLLLPFGVWGTQAEETDDGLTDASSDETTATTTSATETSAESTTATTTTTTEAAVTTEPTTTTTTESTTSTTEEVPEPTTTTTTEKVTTTTDPTMTTDPTTAVTTTTKPTTTITTAEATTTTTSATEATTESTAATTSPTEDAGTDVPVTENVTLLLDLSDTVLVVTATDDNGMPISGLTLHLSIGVTTDLQELVTDEDGQVVFRAGFPIYENNVRVSVESDTLTRNHVTYLSAFAAVTANPAADTDDIDPAPSQGTTATGTTTTTTASGTTQSPIKGQTTATSDGTTVAMNVMTDSGLLALFGSEFDTFVGRSRLLISQKDYTRYTQTYGGTLLGTIFTSPLTMDASHAYLMLEERGAFSAGAAFAGCKDLSMYTTTFCLGLHMMMPSGEQYAVERALPKVDYTVELPIPQSMQNCTVFGVVMVDEHMMTTPVRADVFGGMVSFTTSTVGDVMLIGFEGDPSILGVSDDTSSPLWGLIIVLFVVGLILLAGVGIFVYVFFIRKREETTKAEEEKINATEGTGTILLDEWSVEPSDESENDEEFLDSGTPLLPVDEPSDKNIVSPTQDGE